MINDYPKTINAQGVEVVDTSDGAWATYRAEGRDQLTRAEAGAAQTAHEIAMVKAEGLNALNTVQYDPDVLAGARVLYNEAPSGPSVAAIIERVVIPIREKYLEDFNTVEPVTTHKVGEHEAAFNRIVQGGNNE